MGMTSKERVLAALDFKAIDRVPIDLGGYSGATSINVKAYQKLLQHLGMKTKVQVANPLMNTADIDDKVLDRFHVDTKCLSDSCSIDDFDSPEKVFDPLYKVNWIRSRDFTYAPVEGPFQKITQPTLKDLENFLWPKAYELMNFELLRKKAEEERAKSDRALIGRLPPGIFYIAQTMRGLENWICDLVLNTEFIDAFHEILLNIWIETTELLLDALGSNVDILISGDDFGFQNQPIMSPEMFQERIKPLLKIMFETPKKRNSAKVGLHSCGSVYDLMDDFMDIGLDVLNPLQSNAKSMEPDRVKKKADGRLSLWGGIDTHEVLPNCNSTEVREEVKKKLSIYSKNGGYILAPDHNILLDVPPENIVTMYEAAFEFAAG